MLTYRLDEKNKYYSLYRAIRKDIACGNLRSGEKLPGKRSLASHLGISVITVQTAYEQLLAEGYLTSAERRGYFVADSADWGGVNGEGGFINGGATGESADGGNGAEISKSHSDGSKDGSSKDGAENGYLIDLSSGRAPAKFFPFSVWAKLMRSTLSEEGEHLLERVPCDGDPALKRAIAAYLYRFRGYEVDPRYIVIGAGAEYLYGVIVQLLGREGVYAVENPVYGRVPHAYALNGATCVPVSVDDRGVRLDEVERSGARLLHISPSHQYPTGAVTPAVNRLKILNWAERTGAYVVEDDYDSEFRLFGKPLQTMAGLNGERVIYLNTFSKTLAPSMRLGYMVLPPQLYRKYCSLYGHSANVVPLFEQKALAKMLDGGYFERHVGRLKNYYRGVREILLKKIEELPVQKEVIETGGGLHITMRLPSFASDGEIKNFARDRGIKVMCVSDYLFAPSSEYDKIAVINYSSVDIDKLVDARKR